jgi:hypothetical protein
VGFVEILEPLGPSTVVHLRVDSMPHALARAVVTADMPIQIGELVGFRARRDRLHLFDRTTGLRVALDAT